MEQATAQDRLLGAKVGNYEVKQKLGEGGMGSVYLAVHPNIGKRVALKVLHPEFSSNEEVIGRFFNEAKAVNDIQHPNIVDIIDYGEMPSATGSGQKVVYFIMEFLAGDSLAKLIHDQAPLAPERAQIIAMQVADALGASHRHGIVHRDLKPDNVMISVRRDGRDFVKVLDFGIAKLTSDNPGSRRTRTGIVMGTPAYMSPEQCEGRGLIDHRTDIYSLGILLYEMLTAEVPFRGEGYGEILVQHMTQVPRKPSTIRGVVPPHLEAVCMKALEKRPSDRFADMDQFMRALQDPVGYVESQGGLDHFLSYSHSYAGYQHGGLYQPSPSTPYPVHGDPMHGDPAHARLTTPMSGGQVGLRTPMPHLGAGSVAGKSHDARAVISAPSSYRTPAPGEMRHGIGASRIALVALAAVAVGVGAFFGYRALAGPSTRSALRPAPEREPVGQVDTPPAGKSGETTGKDGAKEAVTPPELKVDPIVEKVTIAVESKPAGAKVFVAGEAESRGVTPTTVELERGDVPVEIVLKAEGYADKSETVVPSENRGLDLVLTAAEKPDKDAKDDDRASARSDSERKERDRERRRRRSQERDRGQKDRGEKDRGEKGEGRTNVGDDILRPEL